MNSNIISKKNLAKKINLNDYIDSSENGNVFSSAWFVDLKNVQDFIVIEDDKNIKLIMPLFRQNSNSKVLNQSTMYIPYGGPVYSHVPKEERNKIRMLRELNTELIKLLKDNFAEVSFSTDPYLLDVMPFIRNGFMPEIRYTYKLDIKNCDSLYSNYGRDRKKDIRKANQSNLKFELDRNLSSANVSKFVEWEGKYGFPSSASEVTEILSEAIKNDNGMVFVAKFGEIVVGAVGMLWRNRTAYIMYSYYDKKYNVGAIAFLYDKIFRYLSENKNIEVVDFEGSVYESVENWNISFNAYQDRFYNLHYNINGNEEIARKMYEYFEK